MKSARVSRLILADHDISDPSTHVRVSYIEHGEVQSRISAPLTHPMAVVSFGQTLSYCAPCPAIILDLPQVAGPQLCEVWTSDQPVHVKTDGEISTATNGNCLIGVMSLDEKPGLSLDAITCRGYQEILTCLQDSGYPYLWRIWNYFPHINEDQDGLERYRRFCAGRHQALAETLYGFPFSLPAATAVGTKSGPLQIMFLAGTKPAEHLGNPRQVNAYDYPLQYGPRSPSFARATLLRSEQKNLLFVAGTASIVGHASRHTGLPAEQTRESIQNVLAVLEHAGFPARSSTLGMPGHVLYKIYVRDRDSLSEIQEIIQESPLAASPQLFLQGDLCRRELLVEIEGLVISE